MKTKTEKEIIKYLNDTKNLNHLANLSSRWNCEKEFEDFAEYENSISKFLPKGWNFVKGTKRPFGFVVIINDMKIHMKIHIFLKKRGNYVNLVAKTVK